MGRYLMTHSLLASWLYTMKENPYEDASTERDPYAEFLQVLRREPPPSSRRFTIASFSCSVNLSSSMVSRYVFMSVPPVPAVSAAYLSPG